METNHCKVLLTDWIASQCRPIDQATELQMTHHHFTLPYRKTLCKSSITMSLKWLPELHMNSKAKDQSKVLFFHSLTQDALIPGILLLQTVMQWINLRFLFPLLQYLITQIYLYYLVIWWNTSCMAKPSYTWE